MSRTRIISDGVRAVMYDGVSQVAFGPVFHGSKEIPDPAKRCLAFITWLDVDPETLGQRQIESQLRTWIIGGPY